MLDSLLINLDVGPCGAALRIALGIALAPIVHGVFGGGDADRAVLVLASLLFLVKLFSAVGRRLVPAAPPVRAHWQWRRELARYNDSYQWRKLIWVGSGILASGAVLQRTGWEWPLGAACVAAGALAEAVWRRKGLRISPLPSVADHRSRSIS